MRPMISLHPISRQNLSKLALCSVLITSFGIACSSGGGGDGDSGSTGSEVLRATTDCGAVRSEKLQNPIVVREGDAVLFVQAISANVMLVVRNGVEEFIKLQGIGASDEPTAVKNLLAQYAGQTLYFLPPESSCSAVIRGGSEVAVGQLISSTGVSLTEQIIKAGLAGDVEASGLCGEELLAGCYTTLKTGGGSSSGREVSNFLWKPDSESPFNPGGVSILYNPCDAKVLINGEEILNYGPSNGRCVTARSAKPGCEYGSNVKVEVLEESTNAPLSFGGTPFITIPNGCDRVEFAGNGALGEDEEIPGCDAPSSEFQYRPSAPECGGNAAVILSGSLEDAFSVQLRLSDNSDRLDPSCAEVACTPYKVQAYLAGAGTKIACFGAPGTSPLMTDIVQVTIKLSGDDSTPERVCLNDPSVAIN